MWKTTEPRTWLIAGWITLQMALPLAYYVGHDPFDERFAWRMFSEIRVVRCEVAYTARGAPVALSRRFHVAWIRLAERARPAVLRAMSSELCADGAPVTLELTCRMADRSRTVLEDGRQDLCEGGGPYGASDVR